MNAAMRSKRKKQNFKEGLIWMLIPQGESTRYGGLLVGTMHTRDQRAFEAVAGAFSMVHSFDVIATEFNLDEWTSQQLQERIPISNWWEKITESKRKRIIQFAQKAGFENLEMYQSLPPIFLVQAFTEFYLGNELPSTMDQMLVDKAKWYKRTLDGLETGEEQITILNQIAEKDQLRQLFNIVKNRSKFRKKINKELGRYVNGQIDKMAKNTAKQLKGLRKILLHNRNMRMAERIDEKVQTANHFFAVGAAHLGGKNGILQLLHAKGYQIHRLTPTRAIGKKEPRPLP